MVFSIFSTGTLLEGSFFYRMSRISDPDFFPRKSQALVPRILLSIVGAKEGGVRATSMICSFDSSMIQTTSSSLFFGG